MADQTDLEVHALLQLVVRSLVDRPEDVEITSVPDRDGTLFQIRAHAYDVARLIGPNGRTAQALRIMIGATAKKHGRRFSIEILHGINLVSTG